MYDPAKIVLSPDFAAWPTVPPGFPKAAIRPRNADLFIGRGASESEARQVIRAYLASISWADYNLGRVVAELERLKLRDNTVIVFVADHGYQLGEKGKWSKAGSLFEGGTRVPLIISMPGAKGNGSPCLRMTQSLDLYRTLCELPGLEPPPHVLGTSVVPLLQDPRGLKWDQPGYSIWSEDGKTIHGTAVRTQQWRYAEYGKDAVNGGHAAQRPCRPHGTHQPRRSTQNTPPPAPSSPNSSPPTATPRDTLTLISRQFRLGTPLGTRRTIIPMTQFSTDAPRTLVRRRWVGVSS